MTVPFRYQILALAIGLVALAGGACSKDQPSVEQRLARANELLSSGQLEQAEAAYRDILRTDSANRTAKRQLGIIYFDQGQLPQAFPLLRQAAEAEPENVDVNLKLGLLHLASGARKEAREQALKVLKAQTGNEQALLLLADTAVEPNDVAETRKLIEGFRAQDQDRAGYHVALGALGLRQKTQADAESEFKAALKLDPGSSAARLALAALYLARNDSEAARQELKSASDASDPRSPARLRYVDFLLRTGSTDEARKILEDMNSSTPGFLPARVYLMKFACQTKDQSEDCAKWVQGILAQDPTNYEALYIRGSTSLDKREAVQAVRIFEQLARVNGRNAQVRLRLALSYLLYAQTASPDARNAIDAAETNLGAAVGLDPSLNQAAVLLAELKLRKGNAAAAIDLLGPLAEKRPPIAQAHYLLASAYLAQRNTKQALSIFQQMAELFPKDPQPPLLAGLILLENRQQPEARKALEKSAEISPDFLLAMEKLVDLDIAEGQYAGALARVQKQIDKNEKLAQSYAIRAKIYLAQRDFARAEPDLLKAIELDPNMGPAYDLLARLYVTTNRHQEAIDKLTALTEKNKHLPALMQLAAIHEQLKHYEAASQAYEKSLSVNPKFFLALNNLAVLYSDRLGRLEDGYEVAKRAREAAPEEPHAADTLGWILFKKKDYSNALPLLEQSADKLGDNAEVQFHVGMARYMMGQDEFAKAALQRAAEASADFLGKATARQRLAVLAIEPAKAADSRAELERHLRERPDDPGVLLRIAEVQKRDGAASEAIKTYEKIAQTNPQFAPATQQLAMLYSEQGTDDPKAYDVVVKARRAYPDDPEITKALGILEYRQGKYSQSAELLELAATKRQDDPILLYYLGMSYHQLKRAEPTKTALDGALARNLPAKLAEEARRVLKECCEQKPN